MQKILSIKSVVFFLSGVVTLIGAIVVLGWHWNLMDLLKVLGSAAPTQYNAGLGLFLAGLGLWAANLNRRWLSLGAGLGLFLLGFFTLIQYVADIDLGIDRLFFDAPLADKTSHPGRMAPIAATSFICTGLAYWLNAQGLFFKYKGLIISLLGMAILSLAVTASYGYLANIEAAYGWGQMTRMGVLASVAFLALGLAVFGLGLLRHIQSDQDPYILLGLSVSLGSVLVSLFLWQALSTAQVGQLESYAKKELENLASRVEFQVLSRIQALERMARRAQKDPNIQRLEWVNDVQNLMQHFSGYELVARIDQKLKVHWVMPGHEAKAKEYEALLLSARPELRVDPLAEKASMLGPLVGPRGQLLFFIFAPIYTSFHESGGQSTEGYILGGFDYKVLFQGLLSSSQFFAENEFDLEVMHQGQSVYKTAGAEKIGTAIAITKEIELYGTKFDMKLAAREMFFKIRQSALPTVVLLTGLVVSFLLGLLSLVNLRLRAAIEKSRSVISAAMDPIILINQEGVMVDVNPSALREFGYKSEELLGKNISMLMPAPYCDQHDDYLNKYLQTGQKNMIGRTREVGALRRTGEIFPVLVSVSEYFVRGQRYFVGFIKNITEIKAAQNMVELKAQELEATNRFLELTNLELNRSNEELAQFAFVASHDLQTPLRHISSFTQLLVKKCQDHLDPESEKWVRYIVDGAERMKRLLNDLLTYSRVGKSDIMKARVDLNPLVEGVLRLLGPAIAERKARVEVATLPIAFCYSNQIEQLFQNLIENALKFVPPGREPLIKISAESIEGGWKCCVEDNGLGIPEEFRERIFNVFTRLQREHEVSGTGIGLAICKKIAENHHGKIWVESTQGLGSAFYFTILESPPASVSQSPSTSNKE